jgi:hypothetical protein
MGAYLALLATVFAQLKAGQDAKDAEVGRHEQAKKLHLIQMRRELAQQLDPSTPMFGAENADFARSESLARRQFGAQQDARTAQMYGSILPAAVSAFGNAWGNQPPSTPAVDSQILKGFDANSQPLPYQNDDASQLRWS